MKQPLVLDGYCGLGGWSEGFIAEGWDCIGIDIERHDYGKGEYPGRLILRDMLTVHGSEFKHVDCIVMSPPCQFFSYTAMPWSRARQLAKDVRADPDRLEKELSLFKACFRIQREAIAAAGHFIPMVVENVRGAQPWVGRAKWNFGSFYLWGDVPALMPITMPRRKSKVGSWDTTRANFNPDKTWDEGRKGRSNFHVFEETGAPSPNFTTSTQRHEHIKNTGGSWFNIGSPGQKEVNRNPVHELAASDFKTQGMNWSNPETFGKNVFGVPGRKRGVSFTDAAGFAASQDLTRIAGHQTEGVKGSNGYDREHPAAFGWKKPGTSSKSNARKAASATIAKIPLALARWIAKVYFPRPPQ